MKPGWKTTEFWMASAAALVGLLLSSGLFDADASIWSKGLGLAAAALTSAGYAVSRGLAKRNG